MHPNFCIYCLEEKASFGVQPDICSHFCGTTAITSRIPTNAFMYAPIPTSIPTPTPTSTPTRTHCSTNSTSSSTNANKHACKCDICVDNQDCQSTGILVVMKNGNSQVVILGKGSNTQYNLAFGAKESSECIIKSAQRITYRKIKMDLNVSDCESYIKYGTMVIFVVRVHGIKKEYLKLRIKGDNNNDALKDDWKETISVDFFDLEKLSGVDILTSEVIKNNFGYVSNIR